MQVNCLFEPKTPPGAKITATARYVGRDDKLYDFEVIASDGGGEIGRARHKRSIVSVKRLQENASRRIRSSKWRTRPSVQTDTVFVITH